MQERSGMLDSPSDVAVSGDVFDVSSPHTRLEVLRRSEPAGVVVVHVFALRYSLYVYAVLGKHNP